MDLSFSFAPHGGAPDWVVSFADIKAIAHAKRTTDYGANASVQRVLRGQGDTFDHVHILARAIAQENSGLIDAAMLEGSFNPVVAHQLLVGKTE